MKNRGYRRSAKRLAFGLSAALTGVMGYAVVSPMVSYAAVTYNMKVKTLKAANIFDATDVGAEGNAVSRGEFAKILVSASSYHNSVSSYTNVAVFSDVAEDNENAAYIRVAAEQGWMSAYLGGLFKPDQPVTYQEAVRACLKLLGYTDSDFSGNIVANSISKAQSIGLTEDIAVTGYSQTLSRQDCVNLFYNLMKTNTKSAESQTRSSSTIYGSILGFTLSSDNELNMLSTLQANLKGPYVLKSGKSLSTIIPFKEQNASCYLNGAESSVTDIEEAAESDGVAAIYYNSSTKSVYAYTSSGASDSDGNSIGVASGTLDAIYYNSTSVMTPTSITVDGTEYKINNTDMQYAFSVYGTAEVNDDITIVYETNSDGDKEVIAYVQ